MTCCYWASADSQAAASTDRCEPKPADACDRRITAAAKKQQRWRVCCGAMPVLCWRSSHAHPCKRSSTDRAYTLRTRLRSLCCSVAVYTDGHSIKVPTCCLLSEARCCTWAKQQPICACSWNKDGLKFQPKLASSRSRGPTLVVGRLPSPFPPPQTLAGSLVGVQLKFQAWIVAATGNGRAQETPETIDILITYQALCWGRPRSTYWQSDWTGSLSPFHSCTLDPISDIHCISQGNTNCSGPG